MASTCSSNVTEILPGLENFLRSMLTSAYLDSDHRQIAAMYLDKLDQYSLSTAQQSCFIDDPSLMNTDVISDDDDDDESDDFTDEEEQQTPTLTRQSSICDKQTYDTTATLDEPIDSSHSQWYTDIPKNDYSDAQLSNGHHETSSSIMQSQLSLPSSSSSSIIADGLLLTYDKNHNWIWRYYVLDDYDLICFPAEKKSRASNDAASDQTCAPLWVSDITNAKVHSTVIDKNECLCLYIGLAEAIYVRPADPNELPMWLKAFRDASTSQKSRENSKSRTNVKSLSRNARRVFAQFNRKKGQIVSHLLDQMANVTGVDDKTRKHCELRGFLVISLNNVSFATRYCTIVDGILRIHKSRLSEHTEQQFDLHRCTLSFPEERTRDIQFALIDEQASKIFIRGNNIYSMGRLLNTLAKYVEITGSSPHVFNSHDKTPPTLTSKSPPSRVRSLSHLNEGYSPASNRALPLNIYRSASKLHEAKTHGFSVRSESNILQNEGKSSTMNETYDSPKGNPVADSSIDRNNNHLSQRRNQSRLESLSPSTVVQSPRPPSPDTSSIASSRADPVFCLRSLSSSSSSRTRSRRPHPLPRRTSLDYVNKLTNLFTRNTGERRSTTQPRTVTSPHVYDIPIAVERASQSPAVKAKASCAMEDDQPYDNVSKGEGIGKFRFVVPFNHSARSAFSTLKPMESPSSSPSSTLSSFSSNNSNQNNNNNGNHRTRLMTAV